MAGRRGQPVTVHYATADGTATAGKDYTPASGTLTFDPAHWSRRSVPIPIRRRAADDGETVLVNLSAPGQRCRPAGTAT